MGFQRMLTYSDKRVTLILSLCLLLLLPFAFFLPSTGARIACALLMLSAAVIASLLLKKRRIPSIYSKMVLLIMSVMGLLFVALYYLTGIVYGLYYALVRLSLSSFFEYILPIAAIIVASEIVRHVLLAQESRLASVLAFAICIFAEILASASIGSLGSFHQFADMLGYTVFPAVTANVLYCYLSKRYGIYPNISYRLITSLFPYIIPYSSQLSPALYAFARLAVPLIIYWFIDLLYERRRRYALEKKSKASFAVGVIALGLMVAFIMLISCQFKYGMIVIATDSMTGELNRGDAVVYTAYDGQSIEKGQVIVFEKNKTRVVHRVVDVQNINGVTRYYTKGDANEDDDAGYITRADIIGLTNFKISYIGMPTLWVRDIFS